MAGNITSWVAWHVINILDGENLNSQLQSQVSLHGFFKNWKDSIERELRMFLFQIQLKSLDKVGQILFYLQSCLEGQQFNPLKKTPANVSI